MMVIDALGGTKASELLGWYDRADGERFDTRGLGRVIFRGGQACSRASEMFGVPVVEVFLYTGRPPPTGIHVDGGDQDVSTRMLVPLWTDGPMDACRTIFFAQRYLGRWHRTFRRGYDMAGAPEWNRSVALTEYEGHLDGLTGLDFPEDYRVRNMSHILPSALHGLTVESEFDWRPGAACLFGRAEVHTANHWHTLGVSLKRYAVFSIR